jgi:hypothetical protein
MSGFWCLCAHATHTTPWNRTGQMRTCPPQNPEMYQNEGTNPFDKLQSKGGADEDALRLRSGQVCRPHDRAII